MRKILITVAVLATVGLAFGYTRVPALFQGEKQEALPTFRVGRSTITEATVALGTIKSKVGAEVDVGSRLSGVVAELKVGIGDQVTKGEPLASLEDDEWLARIDVLEAELEAAKAQLEYAQGELERLERLSDLVAESQIDEARRNLKVLRGEVGRVRARLAEARIQLDYTVIRAPVSGTIASVSTYEGETVAASFAAPTFVTILDPDRLEVQAYVDETDIGRVHVGQEVTFRVDAYSGSQLSGVVSAIYPKAELVNNVVNYVVIVDILDRQGLLLRPEMTTHVSFVLEQKEDVLAVPRSALVRKEGRDLVVVKENDGWVERPVETGLRTPQQVEIVDGLKEGDSIVSDKRAWQDRGDGA